MSNELPTPWFTGIRPLPTGAVFYFIEGKQVSLVEYEAFMRPDQVTIRELEAELRLAMSFGRTLGEANTELGSTVGILMALAQSQHNHLDWLEGVGTIKQLAHIEFLKQQGELLAEYVAETAPLVAHARALETIPKISRAKKHYNS